MYGPLTGLYFEGKQHTPAIHIMPRKPAHIVHSKPQMPTVGFPALERRLRDGDVRFAGQNTGNYGFAGYENGAERLYWLA